MEFFFRGDDDEWPDDDGPLIGNADEADRLKAKRERAKAIALGFEEQNFLDRDDELTRLVDQYKTRHGLE